MTDKAEPRRGPRGGANPAVRDDDRRRTHSGHRNEVREGEREKVAEYARYLTSRQIGLILRGPAEPLTKDWICDNFGPELAWGKANMIALAGGKLVDAVLAGKESSIKFYLTTQGEPGQFVERREISGPGGGPLQTVDLAALAEFDLEELKAFERVASIFARRFGGDDTGEPAAVPAAP